MGYDKQRKAAYAKQYRLKNNDKLKQKWKEYYQNNKEKRKEYKRIYSLKNKDKIEKKRKEYRANNPNYMRNYWIKREYGVDLQWYENELLKQNGCCAICGTKEPGKNRPFSIDHDHNTDEIRGLLCIACNTGLGAFMDSKEILLKAIEYLEKRKSNTP